MRTPFKMKGWSPFTKRTGNIKPLDAEGNERSIDPFSINERAYENAQNDFDTSNPTKAQIAAAKAKIIKEKE